MSSSRAARRMVHGVARAGFDARALGRTLVLCAAAALSACIAEGPRRISDSGFGAYEVSLAVQPQGLAVAWYDTRDGNAEIYLRFLDAQGRRVGFEHRLTENPEDSYEADIEAVGDAVAIVWYDKDAAGGLRAKLGLWDPSSGFRWRVALSSANVRSRNPVVGAFADRIFCAWIEGEEGDELLLGGWWDLAGRPVEVPAVLGPVGSTTWNLNAAIDSAGRAYVVFDARVDTAAEELYLARMDGLARSLIRLTDDDGYRSKYPDLALESERAALTWFDERDGNREVYLFAGDLAALDAGMEARAERITRTPGESIGAYVAWNDERIGLAWSDHVDGAMDIHFQSFDATGAPLTAIKRLTRTRTRSSIPAIRPWGTGFAMAWNEVAPGPAGLHDQATRSEVEFMQVR